MKVIVQGKTMVVMTSFDEPYLIHAEGPLKKSYVAL